MNFPLHKNPNQILVFYCLVVYSTFFLLFQLILSDVGFATDGEVSRQRAMLEDALLSGNHPSS